MKRNSGVVRTCTGEVLHLTKTHLTQTGSALDHHDWSVSFAELRRAYAYACARRLPANRWVTIVIRDSGGRRACVNAMFGRQYGFLGCCDFTRYTLNRILKAAGKKR
jgi:hypothetical protein